MGPVDLTIEQLSLDNKNPRIDFSSLGVISRGQA
jgi:hypothetical protein